MTSSRLRAILEFMNLILVLFSADVVMSFELFYSPDKWLDLMTLLTLGR
ncbi:hypothetical protein IC575_002200 [Cucumis melo]